MDLTYALLGGTIPALLWLWFWLREDRLHPEPRGLIFFTFVAGMAAIPFAFILQKYATAFFPPGDPILLFVWAAIEEVAKLAAAFFIAYRSRFIDEPMDALIFIITAAIGFSALENSLYIYKHLAEGDIISSINAGNLRFIGATLLHIVSSAAIGVGLAITYYKHAFMRFIALLVGVILASTLHAAFNYFIIRASGSGIFEVFAYVWVGVIILLLMFERVKRVTAPNQTV